MSESNLAKDILKEILNILSLRVEKMDCSISFAPCKKEEEEKYLREKYSNINFVKQIKNISFETNDLYKYFLVKICSFLRPIKKIQFDSSFSFLYFNRIIGYLKKLVENNIDIVEDDLVKIFIYILLLFFDENLIKEKANEKNLDLDETFFKGTFLELKERYSSKLVYEDSKEAIEFINAHKKTMRAEISSLVFTTFQNIQEILTEYGDQTEDLIKDMLYEVNDILYELSKSQNELTDNLIKKIKDFYSKNENLIFTNYISENEDFDSEIKKIEPTKMKITKNFIQQIKGQYSPFEFNYNSKDVISTTENHKKILNDYIGKRNKFYKRMKYSSFYEIFKYDLNDEIVIFAFSKYEVSTEFMFIQKLINKVKNLEQNEIIGIIKDILNENDFYEYYFSLLQSDIIMKFFTSHLSIENEKDDEFTLLKGQSNTSECFHTVYKNFMEKYNTKKDNYNAFKKLIIFKILPYGDRAYTMRHLNKIVINPVQFLIGEEIDELNIKTILKGYLIVILLHETEHFFRVWDKSKSVFPHTPKDKEGGRMFIKYLFGVLSINHINLEQAITIFNYNTWKNHNQLKKIFSGQLEDIEEDNINDFLLKYFKSSISFFSTRAKKGAKKGIFNLDEYLRK